MEIIGRFPDKGRITNEVCKKLVYVLERGGKLVVEGEESKLIAMDVVLFEPGDKYYWEGNMKIFTTCHPAWYAEQHRIVK